MIKLKTIGKFGLLSAIFIAGVFAVSQLVSNAYAAQTLNGNNEVITINDTTDGLPVNNTIAPIAYSGDGNDILFSSAATNLKDFNSYTARGLYVYDIRNQVTNRVDAPRTAATGPVNYQLDAPVSSESGRYIMYNQYEVSTSSIYLNVYDRQTGTRHTEDVKYYSGLYQNIDRPLSISDDARFILVASRYIANQYPNTYGIAIGDRTTATPIWTSLHKGSGNEGSNSSTAVAGKMSCDGSFVVYQKLSGIELLDLRSGAVKVVSSMASNSASPLISCNGRYVLYLTQNRTEITPTPAGMNSYYHLVRYDRITGEKRYIDSNSSDVFSSSTIGYSPLGEPIKNGLGASISDTGDVVFTYNGNSYLKHLSDGSGTLESVAKTSAGVYLNMNNGTITSDGRYIFFTADPYTLGLAPSASTKQLIRAKTGL